MRKVDFSLQDGTRGYTEKKKSAWELSVNSHILWPSGGLCSFSLWSCCLNKWQQFVNIKSHCWTSNHDIFASIQLYFISLVLLATDAVTKQLYRNPESRFRSRRSQKWWWWGKTSSEGKKMKPREEQDSPDSEIINQSLKDVQYEQIVNLIILVFTQFVLFGVLNLM